MQHKSCDVRLQQYSPLGFILSDLTDPSRLHIN